MEIQWLKNLIEKIQVVINHNKVNSPSLKISNKAKDAKTQVGQIIVNQGLSYSDAKDLIISVVDQKMITFKDEAKTTFDQRTGEFKKLLSEKIRDLPEKEMGKLRDPDTQIALLEAASISGRKSNDELRNLLANLVVSRIKNDSSGKEELKNIVYNEAISTVSKLTIDQLKVIALCYLLRYTSYGGIISWETFNNYLNTHIKPFMGFKNSNAQFQHIEYAGCGSIGIGSWNLIEIYRQQYSFLFLNLIEKEKIDGLNLPKEILAEIIKLDPGEGKYFISVRNKIILEKYLNNKHLTEETTKQFSALYEQSIKSPDEVKKKIQDETDIGKEFIELSDGNANILHLSLTSVGIAIGASYFEQTVGEKINIDIWIN